MVRSAADWQAWILQEVGAALEPVDLLTPAIASLWDAWAAKAAAGPYVQALYAKRHCLQILLGQHRLDRNATLGPLNSHRRDRFDNLAKMLADTDLSIKREEQRAAAGRPGAVLALRQTAPVLPAVSAPLPSWATPTPQTDYAGLSPNQPGYAGSPVERTENR